MVKLQFKCGLPFCSIKLIYKGNEIILDDVLIGMDLLKSVGAIIDLDKMILDKSH
ncbi:hypothetical protein LL037_16490 [Clostridium estertheticum]|uniref:Uncharacterized protein n=1 Tax=Clostridium estertheticum TaxID=238834 RepID=A0AA47EKB6_9CLOT|nr:hypothetical protein [Clostridium estertheticum]MBU3157556.1 hypothetical protein [Clostridium estertheticum]MBU3200833.1 hypothetical protein [Clostridium estertheticum]WAG61813.1 hypothetical protein LL038_06090 [Clostridium estertheticum]WAG64066.1 hypothetical protein LL037_16490 [Clostridium estertheticum]